jgi:UDP:flavonoid glycosyltransferase YjiC (YdhE family)
MRRKKKILFVVEALTFAHVARCAVLAASLKWLDYDIVFACHPSEHLHLVGEELTGMTIWPLKHFVSYEHYLATMSNGESPYSLEVIEDYIEEEIDLIKSTEPDLVIGDLRYSLSISCHRAGVHYVNLVNAIWSPFIRQKLIVPENNLTKGVGVPLANFLLRLTSPLCFRTIINPFNKLRARERMSPLGDIFDLHCSGDTNLYLDAPSLFDFAPLPNNHQFIGPVLYSMKAPTPEWLKTVDPHPPIVFVTLGSSGAVDCLPALLECLSTKRVTAFVATSGRTQLANVPANIFISTYLPAREILAKASLVISNGGSPVSYLALSQGVPILAICSNMDQHLSAQAVENYGAAIALRSEKLENANVGGCIDALLQNPRFRGQARVIAQEINMARTIGNFHRAIENAIYRPIELASTSREYILSTEKTYEH